MNNRLSDICVICGKNHATTKDHLPPQSMFPKPRPSDLITVPACAKCNNENSELDEVFKVLIGIQAGHGPEGERLFLNQTSRTLTHNLRLTKGIINAIREAEIVTFEGLLVGTAPVIPIDKSYDIVIERIIRGLHWHHTGHILGDEVDIKVNLHRTLTKQVYDMTHDWETGIVGGNQFIYKYFVADEAPMASVWVLEFFGSAWSSGTVFPKIKSDEDHSAIWEEKIHEA